jgi:vancomycin permeability regulator SanA
MKKLIIITILGFITFLQADKSITFNCGDYEYKTIKKDVSNVNIVLGQNKLSSLYINKNVYSSVYDIRFRCGGTIVFEEKTNDLNNIHYKEKNYYLDIKEIKK